MEVMNLDIILIIMKLKFLISIFLQTIILSSCNNSNSTKYALNQGQKFDIEKIDSSYLIEFSEGYSSVILLDLGCNRVIQTRIFSRNRLFSEHLGLGNYFDIKCSDIRLKDDAFLYRNKVYSINESRIILSDSNFLENNTLCISSFDNKISWNFLNNFISEYEDFSKLDSLRVIFKLD